MSATGSRSNAAGRTMVVRLIRGRPATADTIGMADEIHRAVPRAEIPAHDIPPAPTSSGQKPDHGTGPCQTTVHGDLHAGFRVPRSAGRGTPHAS